MEQLERIDLKQALIIGVGLSVVYYFVFFDNGKRVQAKIRQVESEIRIQTETKQKIQEAIKERERFEQEAEEINTNLKDLSWLIFPARSDANQLMKQISTFAEENKTSILSLKPLEKPPEFPDYPEQAFDFELEGTYHQLMQFISDLTQMKRAIDFNNMKIESDSTRGNSQPSSSQPRS